MSDPILKQEDINLLLKASIDFNSGVLAIVAQVTGNPPRPRRVITELKRLEKHYRLQIDQIAQKYENQDLIK